MSNYWKMILVEALVAAASITLVILGNPGNMGFCVACFLRDTAGALGLHSNSAVQYVRPEIIGIILGSLIISVAGKEFSSKGGSAPVTRFILGACVMIGALIFLGCPLRMVLRIAGGDLNAVVGLLGFVAGILAGIFFLNKGFSLDRTYILPKIEGYAFPVLATGLLIILLFVPGLLLFSTEGPGAAHAPIIAAITAGIIIGIAGQKTRLCFVAGIRDSILFKEFSMLIAFIAIIVFGVIGNIAFAKFQLGFAGQPIAHTDGLWNFLSMILVGTGSVLLGGCPFRQLILAGSGNSDSVITILGFIAGAAIAINFKLASSASGVTANGKIGFAVALVAMLIIAFMNLKKPQNA